MISLYLSGDALANVNCRVVELTKLFGYLPNGADCPQGFSIHLEKIKTKNTLKNFVLPSNWSLVATPREFLRWENLELNISFSLSHQYLRNYHCMWPACIFPGKNYQARSLYFTRNWKSWLNHGSLFNIKNAEDIANFTKQALTSMKFPSSEHLLKMPTLCFYNLLKSPTMLCANLLKTENSYLELDPLTKRNTDFSCRCPRSSWKISPQYYPNTVKQR